MISTICTYSKEDVSLHNTPKSCWVIYKNFVYDVTEFFDDHPGGGKIILDYAGMDITEIFLDKFSHVHSENAEEILKDFLVGELRSSGGGDDSIAHVNNYTLTDAAKDFKEENFLDLSKPLLEQMFFNNFTKEFYLKQVHKPRYTKGSPRFLSSPFLEKFTLTDWYIVPLFWIPICFLFGYWSSQVLPLSQVGYLYLMGIFIFSLIEYILHRFVFHLDDIVPDHPMFLFMHFFFHGVHHYIPMDRKRLVLPPMLSSAIGGCLIKIVYLVCPRREISNGLIGGAIIGYMCYDLMHYYIHHGHMFIEYFRIMKSYHMAHHHTNYSLGFGVTSKLWDFFFGTLLLPTTPSNIFTSTSSKEPTQ